LKKKILFLLHVPPPVHGSSMVGKYIMDSGLINENFDTRYINLGTSSSVDEIGKGGLKKLIKYFKIIFQTLTQIFFYKPNLAYIAMTAKGGAFYKDVLIAFLLKAFHIPLVIHFHNKGVSVNQEKKIDNFLYQKVFKNSKIILLSKYLYSDIQKYVAEKDVYYCPNGIPELVVKEIKRENRNGIVNLLFLSNLIASKGVFILLEALHILDEKNIDFTCTFIGGEGDINAASFNIKVKELGLSDKVKYLGRKYGDEKNEYFSASHVFVFPTYYHNECFPLVLLEAMQFSLPIISTFEGGIPDLIVNGVNGFLVKQQLVAELSDNISILIEDADLRIAMGEDGRKRFQEHFTISIFEQTLCKILTQITTQS
jgi:glycosyltransferase involved in cell wall biosynthesis